jgi:hypothetical protein
MKVRFSLIVCLVFLGACNGSGDGSNSSDPNLGQQNTQVGTGSGSGTGTGGGVPVGTTNGEKCYKQTFHEPDSAPDKLDVLLVANTREQETFLREDLVANWFSYEFALPRHSDFRVAVMLGGGSDSGLAGRLWHHWAEPAVLHQHPYSCDWDVTDGLIADFWNLPLECRNDQGEEEFYSLAQGVTSPHRSEWSEREGFFRRDAMLAVVFVSDVPDACFQSEQKGSARADCDGFSVRGLFESLRAFKGGMPVIYEGVVHNDHRGAGFTDLIHLGKGLVVDPDDKSCEGPADIMRKLGSFAGKTAFIFPTGFPLAMESLDPAAFQVWVDQNPTTDFTYDQTDNTISVPSAAHAGADVVVQYCVEQSGPSPSPVPSSSVTPVPSPSVTSTPAPSPSPTPIPSPTPSSTDSGTPTPTPSPSDSGCVGPLCGSGPIGV